MDGGDSKICSLIYFHASSKPFDLVFLLLEKTLPKPSQERKSRKSSERKLRKSSSDKEPTWVYRTVTEKSGKHQTGAGITSNFGDITDIDEESREDSNNDYNKYSLFNAAQTLHLKQRFVVIFLQAIFAVHLHIITVWFYYQISYQYSYYVILHLAL